MDKHTCPIGKQPTSIAFLTAHWDMPSSAQAGLKSSSQTYGQTTCPLTTFMPGLQHGTWPDVLTLCRAAQPQTGAVWAPPACQPLPCHMGTAMLPCHYAAGILCHTCKALHHDMHFSWFELPAGFYSNHQPFSCLGLSWTLLSKFTDKHFSLEQTLFSSPATGRVGPRWTDGYAFVTHCS